MDYAKEHIVFTVQNFGTAMTDDTDGVFGGFSSADQIGGLADADTGYGEHQSVYGGCVLVNHVFVLMVRREGFEPPTLGSEDRCSIQLS